MSSYRRVIYHIVFATINRQPTISEQHCQELYRYIGGVIAKRNSIPYEINGVGDHIHILSDLNPSISLANFVKEIKIASNAWMKESGKFPLFDGWQEGYSAFTYSLREKSTLVRYVLNQKVHHNTESLEEEYKRLLKEHQIRYDDRYLF
ncbi:transposase [Chryseolinea soli]|uniref:Transposase n=1 Tax=Chryseolinea soli TaxID=2321403 RepID=A0A385SEE0_9BACT|nr:transposase [Chryseolinea soli]AYB29314.1 transposase [Chryseolinea soli]